jgi:hypothetical protein
MTSGTEIRYELWQAVNDDDFFDRVIPCPMRLEYAGMADFTPPDPTEALTPEDFQKPFIKVLDGLFEIFNISHPHDFFGHSLSVHDVVCLGETAFRCMPYGWEVCPAPKRVVGVAV